MRTAVLAAALAFGPHLAVLRAPARTLGHAVMNWLDRRREQVDGR
jgi:hypothetical protein